MIDAFARLPHYVDHIAPIWQALPDRLRGTFQVGPEARSAAARHGIRPGVLRRRRGELAPLTIVASYQDERNVRPRPVVLVEHGAGQSYSDHDPSYPGGTDREAVCLFVAPSERVAQRWREMYPATPVAVVGCPKLDPWHAGWVPPRDLGRPDRLPVVAFSFHWEHGRVAGRIPEARWAFLDYRDEIRALAKLDPEERGFEMLGHAHPRAHEVAAFFRGCGIETLPYFGDVLDRADGYVCDNSSTIFEFASTDRPVVLLNAPHYRRDVEHGLRFWSEADVGIQVDESSWLLTAIQVALVNDVEQRRLRRAAVGRVYAYTDGRATERAAAAIVEVFEAGHWRAWRETRNVSNPFEPAGPVALDGARRAIVGRLRAQGRPLPEDLAERMAGASEGDLEAILESLG